MGRSSVIFLCLSFQLLPKPPLLVPMYHPPSPTVPIPAVRLQHTLIIIIIISRKGYDEYDDDYEKRMYVYIWGEFKFPLQTLRAFSGDQDD